MSFLTDLIKFGVFPKLSAANPTASVGLTAVNGTATTVMRSDGAPALDVTISPTWTGSHAWTPSGTTTPITVTAGTLKNDGTQRIFTMSATVNGTPTNDLTGAYISVTSAGSSNSFFQIAQRVSLSPGFTGNNRAYAGFFDNSAAGIGTNLLLSAVDGSSPIVNGGVYGRAIGTTVGTNIGMASEASNGNVNISAFGRSTVAKNSATNVGVAGFALNTGTTPIQIGGYFSLETSPNFTSAALVADNGGTASPIFLGRVNGTTAVTIGASGQITDSVAGAAGAPALSLTGAWLTTAAGAVAQVLIQQSGATVFAGSAAGTGLGVNAATGFTGSLFDFQLAGSTQFKLSNSTITAAVTMSTQDITAANNKIIGWVAQGGFNSSSDGGIELRNNARTNKVFLLAATAAATPSLQLGGDNAAAPIAQTLQAQGSRAGTDSNVAGATLTLKPGAGTGSVVPNPLVINSNAPVGSGTGVQTDTKTIAFNYGSTIVGPGSALSTSATDGFLYFPTSAGTPAGTPTTQTGTVAFEYDTTNDELEIYSNGQWNGVPVSGGQDTAPAGNVTLRANYSLVVIDSYTIAAAKTLTLGAGSRMRMI